MWCKCHFYIVQTIYTKFIKETGDFVYLLLHRNKPSKWFCSFFHDNTTFYSLFCLVLCYFDSCQDQRSSVCLQYVFNKTILEFSRILLNNSNEWNYLFSSFSETWAKRSVEVYKGKNLNPPQIDLWVDRKTKKDWFCHGLSIGETIKYMRYWLKNPFIEDVSLLGIEISSCFTF